jgi:hypothetical protein
VRGCEGAPPLLESARINGRPFCCFPDITSRYAAISRFPLANAVDWDDIRWYIVKQNATEYPLAMGMITCGICTDLPPRAPSIAVRGTPTARLPLPKRARPGPSLGICGLGLQWGGGILWGETTEQRNKRKPMFGGSRIERDGGTAANFMGGSRAGHEGILIIDSRLSLFEGDPSKD